MGTNNVLGSLPTTIGGGVGAGALYLAIVGAKSPETIGDFVVLGISVAVFFFGALHPGPTPPTAPTAQKDA